MRRIHTRMCAAFVLPFALGYGCSASSTYQRAPQYPGEIVWRFDDQLTVAKDGRSIVDLADLSAELACVPRSVADADEARELESSGSVLAGVGLGVLLVGAVAGAALLIAGASNHQPGLVYGGLGTLGGSLFLGGSLAGTGGSQIADSLALRLDAVNRYNDVIARGGCDPSKVRRAR